MEDTELRERAWALLDDLVADLSVTAVELARFGSYFSVTIRRNLLPYVVVGTGSTPLDAFHDARRVYREEADL